jgi:thiamine pyrophosphate-dependent acetolactate synthase large subunit-like protein
MSGVPRETAMRVVADLLADEIVVAGLGAPCRYLSHLKPRGGTFYLADAMGLPIPLGLGLAVARPRERVLVLDGDGALLMQVGALATVASARVRNLTICIFNNDVYEASGGQPLPAAPVDYPGLARSCGLEARPMIETEAALRAELARSLRGGATTFLCVRTPYDPSEAIPPYITSDPLRVRDDFVRWIASRPDDR